MFKLLLSIFILCISTSANSFDFKGIELGKVSSYEEVGNTLNIQCHDEPDNEVWCSGTTTIVGGDASVSVSLNNKKIVSSIYIKFNPSNFDDIFQAYVKKYGKPKIRKSILSNSMGASFDQIEADWKNKVGSLSLSKYFKKIDEGAIFMMTNDHMNELDKGIEKDKSDI